MIEKKYAHAAPTATWQHFWCGPDCTWHADFFKAKRQAEARSAEGFPKVVCLCGSTRFYEAFQQAYYEETMAGRIVLSVGFKPSTEAHHESLGCSPEQKEDLDRLHFKKIEISDEVYVLNIGGYIGFSTRREIKHARSLGVPVRFKEACDD